MKKIFALTALLLAFAISAGAQIITHSPAILQESSSDVVLTYHADAPEGNNGLLGVTAADPVYAHIGAITNKSNNSWKFAPAWGDNAAKYKLSYVGPNTWTLSLGNMREYFGLTDATEHIQRIALVFRNGSCSKEGKTASGGDIFVDVEPEGYQMRLSSSPSATLVSKPTRVTFTVDVTAPSQIALYVNDTQVKSESDATQLSATYDIATQGSYAVRATATSAQGTIERTLSIAYPGSSEAGTYPGGVPQMGAVRNADGTVTFCLAAPGKSSVVLVPSWDNYEILGKNTMQYQDYNGQRYFFTTVSGLDNSTWYPYYYIVDGTHKVADPYARLVLDPYSDKWLDESVWPDMPKYPYDRFDDVVLAVYKGDFDNSYEFSEFKIPDHRNLIVYELLVRDFTGTEGQANAEGTLRKALDKLSYLSDLGVNVIELLPVMEFNGNNSWGYNTNFYFALDKAYGAPDDLRDFVEQAHRRGIAVVLDIALNHSDGLHPWYQMYDRNANPFYNAEAPHAYSVLNDWKQENPLVQQQWKDALQFWMKSYNIDGYRFDLVKGLGTSYNNGDTEGYNKSRVDVMKRLHSHLTEVKPDAIHINEHLAGSQEENEMAADGQLNWSNQNGVSRNYGSGQTTSNNLATFDPEKCGRAKNSLISYAESHDEERMAFSARNSSVAAIKNNEAAMCSRLGQVAVQMLLTPGSKMIWQFGELAADQTTKNQDGSNNTDPKLVIWDNLGNPNIKALHDTYKALCHFRKDNPGLFIDGTATLTGFANGVNSNRIIRYTNGDQEVMAFIRCTVSGTSTQMVGGASTVLNASNSQLIASSAGFSQSLQGTGTSVRVQLKPNEYAVFATLNTSGVDDITADGSRVTVTGGNGEIIISGDYTDARVYDLQGTSYPTLHVAPGLYIVTVDGQATKVQVK